MAGKNKVDYDVIVAATKGNMVAIGMILENYSGLIDKAVSYLGSGLPEECREECKQEVMLELIRKIQTKFTV